MEQTIESQSVMQNNSILILAPYKYYGSWVFDDERTGLVREAFVAGADTTLDILSGGADKCILLFGLFPFKGAQIKCNLIQTSPGGSDYFWTDDKGKDHDVWLCPALFKYFPVAPENIYVQVKLQN